MSGVERIDRDGPTLDPAEFAQPLHEKRRHAGSQPKPPSGSRAGSSAASALLRARREQEEIDRLRHQVEALKNEITKLKNAREQMAQAIAALKAAEQEPANQCVKRVEHRKARSGARPPWLQPGRNGSFFPGPSRVFSDSVIARV
jgi:chorismate mutase